MLFVLIDGWSLKSVRSPPAFAGWGWADYVDRDVAADIVASGIKVVILLVSVW